MRLHVLKRVEHGNFTTGPRIYRLELRKILGVSGWHDSSLSVIMITL
jgi:hypothetical protein